MSHSLWVPLLVLVLALGSTWYAFNGLRSVPRWRGHKKSILWYGLILLLFVAIAIYAGKLASDAWLEKRQEERQEERKIELEEFLSKVREVYEEDSLKREARALGLALRQKHDSLEREKDSSDNSKNKPNLPKKKVVSTNVARPDTAITWWKHWGAAPFDSSYAGVCQNMTRAIDGFRRMPMSVRQEFKLLLGRTCGGGEEIYITPDMMFWEMWTGGANPYPMQNVAVAKVSVSHSPDGRALREVFQTARGRKWTVEYEGRIYTLVIPYVCYNVAYMVSESDCVTVAFNAPVGGTVSFGVASVNGPLPASSCYAVKQGSGDWKAPYGECPNCEPPMFYLQQVLGDEVQVHHRYRYLVTDQQQFVRFPRAVWQKGVYFCLETSLGMTSCGMYLLPGSSLGAWAGRYFIRFDDGSWRWSNCSDP